jgi:hypothetical protein
MAKEKETVLFGGISFTIKEANKLKKADLKKWEIFLNVPLVVAETQLERFLDKK